MFCVLILVVQKLKNYSQQNMLITYGSFIPTFHILAHICKAFKLVKANISHALIQFFLEQEEDDLRLH
jgi:hypothetical protein